jgi:hypothetical protein
MAGGRWRAAFEAAKAVGRPVIFFCNSSIWGKPSKNFFANHTLEAAPTRLHWMAPTYYSTAQVPAPFLQTITTPLPLSSSSSSSSSTRCKAVFLCDGLQGHAAAGFKYHQLEFPQPAPRNSFPALPTTQLPLPLAWESKFSPRPRNELPPTAALILPPGGPPGSPSALFVTFRLNPSFTFRVLFGFDFVSSDTADFHFTF